ncbi:MAG: hypothetical protein AAFX76_01385 [Planctomycetota bacterium]
MPIDVTCPGCSKTLRVHDRYAGRRGKCPACGGAVEIPAPAPPEPIDDPQLEIVPEDRRTYSTHIQPPPAPDLASLAALDAAPASGSASSGGGDRIRRLAEAPEPVAEPAAPRAQAERRSLQRREAADDAPPWYRRELVSLFGLSLTPLPLLAIPLLLAAAWWWYLTGPGRPAHISAPTPVFVVEVLDHAEVQMPTGRTGRVITSLPGVGGASSVGNASGRVLSVGGSDTLMVTAPDGDGDQVLFNVKLKQGILNNLGQTRKYDSVINADAFELRPAGDPPGTGVKPRLAVESFDAAIDLDLAGADTSNYMALLPPASVKPDRLDVQKSGPLVTGHAEYALGVTRGTVEFSAIRAYDGMPASKGLTANGMLITRHPEGRPVVTADYRGGSVGVSWDAGGTGRWVRNQLVEPSRTSPWSRYDLDLVFPRPADGGRYTLAFAGRDLKTVSLSRMKQPAPPAPNPVASQRPGGPAPASKTSSSPLAYFDVLRDARSQAKGLVSANNMRQIGIALMAYTDDHRGAFPETLLDLRPYLPQLEQVLTNPRTGERPGFIYVPPPRGANPSATPVLYESYQGHRDLNGAILYGDGSIR